MTTQWMEIKIVYNTRTDELTTDLISDLFYNLGAKGVVVDDPHLSPIEGWGSDAVPLPEQPAITGYLPVDDGFKENHRILSESLSKLADELGFGFEVTAKRVDEEDWAESWKTFFHPEKITDRIVVRPSWQPYKAKGDEIVVEIDPGMAFGTGTHPTTALCMQLLESHLKSGDHILDVGTGSGILLVAGAKLGAGHLTGVDNDPVAVAVAKENMALNHIQSPLYDLHCGHLVDVIDRSYDIVVANILADVVVELLDQVPKVMKPGGLFICSGIIETQHQTVAQKMSDCGLPVSQHLVRQEWVALAGRKR